MNDLISVIVPVYNTGQLLARCVDSLLAQTYPEIEIILVDDGSTDGITAGLCDRLAGSHPGVKAFHTANGGSASARNYGLAKAGGSYIGFVDSDDWVEPDMYEVLHSNLKQNGVALSIAELATEENGRQTDNLETLPSGVYDNDGLMHHFFLGHWNSACPNLYHKSLFEGAQFPANEINEDYWLNYLVYKEQPKVFYDNRVLYHYVKRTSSNTSSPISLRFLDWIKHTGKILEDCLSQGRLVGEAWYQYLFSNIVLANKSILTLAKQKSQDAETIYKTVVKNLRSGFRQVVSNRFLSARYRVMGVLLSLCPRTYKALAVLISRRKR